LDACLYTLPGRRDRARLRIGFAVTFRSEQAALQVRDPTELADSFRVLIRRSKMDQTGEGAEIVIPRGLRIQPVQHVRTWLQAAVRFIEVAMCVLGLRGADVAAVVMKQYAEKAGLDPAEFSGHSPVAVARALVQHAVPQDASARAQTVSGSSAR
jgi:hypothetical protein